MLAHRPIPPEFADWNSRHHAPWGRRRGARLVRRLPIQGLAARYLGPYGWCPNSSTRLFEYPWAFHEIARLGPDQRLADVGAGLSGLQFTLARAGHAVHAVDPSFAPGVDSIWRASPELHRRLRRTFRAPVTVHPSSLAEVDIPPHSLDVVLSVSSLEHFSPTELERFPAAARRLLRPDGRLILTVDLFLDLVPFTSKEANQIGRNVDLNALLSAAGADLEAGRRSELYGFPEFDPEQIQSSLPVYLLSANTPYPALSQCVVALVR